MQEIWTPERRAIAIATGNKWKSTPHVDRMASLGRGIDCIHLITEILFDAGIIERRALGSYETHLGEVHENHELKGNILRCLHSEAIEDISAAQFGDIVIGKTGGISGHCSFFTGPHVYQSLAGYGVVRSPWILWRHKAQSLIRITGIGWKDTP